MSLSDEPSSPVEPSPARREPLVSAPPADTEVHAEASRARPAIVVLVLFAAVFALVVVGARPRLTQRAAVEKAHAAANAPRRVRVAKAKAGSPLAEVKLPATSAPLRTTSLFAKTSGFLRKNYVEVGDVVKASQPLADIDSRETDQELALAEARVGEAQANIGLALGTSQRNADLAKLGVVSKQQADDTRALANSATAALKIRQVDVERLRAMRSYQRVLAPFDGTVLRRNVDPGTLVGATGAGGVPLFEIASIDVLRVVVEIPQLYAKDVAKDLPASVFMPQTPHKVVIGKIVRMSAALDATSRTRRTEIEIPGGEILPNAFVYVKLSLPKAMSGVTVPSSALVVRKEGTLVAKVVGDHVALVKIEILRDLGKELDLAVGTITPGDAVVLNPADDLENDAKVEIAEGRP